MPVNVSPHYVAAEKEYLTAETKEQKIRALKKMISIAPKHKGAENLRAQLKRRLAKLKYSKEKEAKVVKAGKKGIKKQDMQAVIIGETNTGKSSLLKALTNAHAEITDYKFATQKPIIGMMNYAGVQIQLIENPAIESEYYDKGLVHTADTLIILIDNLEQIDKIKKDPSIQSTNAKQLIIFNKSDLLNNNKKRKIEETLKSKKYIFALISTKTNENLWQLKEKLFQCFEKIRVFTKEPHKPKAEKPMILLPNSTIKDVAEKILKGFSARVKETKIWGPSSKFPGQKVGLQHELKDLDVVELKTK